ncbi:protein phosphatase [Kibdelosporangium banguiense]|uniref:Protein phosphatase n=1 Tax=Kibdelosporangium banguiense TaxID=1365924 RepID=A0ABS4TUF2_9PSEU|nr:PP2C family serine/threonine-protein phosphatase [Kibdelosporangium banguiense]MBP2328003.1 protein phosphatase [Kibdelosporangium banguiense]
MTRGLVRGVALTGRGLVRQANEDAVLMFEWISQTPRAQVVEMRSVFAPPLVCAVADGLGGHAAGMLASRLALAHIAAGYPQWTDVDGVAEGLRAVSAKVNAQAGASAETQGMGTTVAGVILQRERVLCFNVGDSRVYQITDGFVEQVSTDDAVLNPAGQSTSVVTQAIGDPPDTPVSAHVVEVPYSGSRTRLLLCTDGITGVLEASHFRKLCRERRLRDLALGLRDASFDDGAPDNLSIVALDVHFTEG